MANQNITEANTPDSEDVEHQPVSEAEILKSIFEVVSALESK